ncbi:lipid asymmetry maintenance protein MlaB [Litoribrevibacter euphylliae]|uniref:Lipid asymmetry maintenance protein MlaB n=1 Tax=Litoribrevibacter euphylliae TaxID=1834034 RepID=A0ABV7HBH9_9GAMM
MSCSFEQKADFLVCTLDENLTIFTVSEIYESLSEIINYDTQKIIFELSNVTEIDSAGFQLLLWIQQQFGQEKELTFSLQPESAVQSICDLYRLDLAALDGGKREAI